MFLLSRGERQALRRSRQEKAKGKKNKKSASPKPKNTPKQTKTKDAVPKQTKTKDAVPKQTKTKDAVPKAEGTKSYAFDSSNWGRCKLEMYSEKSYIRYMDISRGKWKSIIGSVAKGCHQECCRRLVPHVADGKSISELYELRAKIIADLS